MPAVTVESYRFTVEDFHTMIESGIFSEDDRVELIEGEIIPMAPPGPEHSAFIDHLTMGLAANLAGRAIVRVQSPIQLSQHSQPQPDVSLLRSSPDRYLHRFPDARSGEVLLAIEVAVSSLAYDRKVKLPLYAQAGVPEVWIVNVEQRVLEVYREPSPDGYQSQQQLNGNETVTLTAFPDVSFRVGELMP